jgi:hypothetical protein
MLGRTGIATIASLGAAALVLSTASAAQAGVFDDLERQLHKIHGKVHTDGTLTVGQQETISVTGLPGKHRLSAFISPPPTASTCFDFETDGFCAPQPLFRVPGTPRLRSSRKGRGTLTFVMPPAYEFMDFGNPLNSHPIVLVNGQTVHVDIETTVKLRVRNGSYAVTGPVADAIAVVEVPAAA